MTWKVICGQQGGVGMEITVNNDGLNAIVNSEIQQESLNVSWTDIDFPFNEERDLSTQGIISFKIRNSMLIVAAELEGHDAEELAFPGDQLDWFKNKLEA